MAVVRTSAVAATLDQYCHCHFTIIIRKVNVTMKATHEEKTFLTKAKMLFLAEDV